MPTPSLPSQEGSGLKLMAYETGILKDCLPSQEGSGLKLSRNFRSDSLYSLPSQEGSGLKPEYADLDSGEVMSSLARGKWIEAYLHRNTGKIPPVFPRKREVD